MIDWRGMANTKDEVNDLTNLTPDFYFLMIESGSEKSVSKIIITKN